MVLKKWTGAQLCKQGGTREEYFWSKKNTRFGEDEVIGLKRICGGWGAQQPPLVRYEVPSGEVREGEDWNGTKDGRGKP